MEVIQFYSTGAAYGCFSNFSKHKVTFNGKEYPTSEHYFQSQKFIGTPHEEEARLVKTAFEVAQFGRRRDLPCRSDWATARLDVMREALYAKFTQHKDIQATLLGTGDAQIVEHTANDSYWADGGDGTGLNMLGVLLMETRAKIRSELASSSS